MVGPNNSGPYSILSGSFRNLMNVSKNQMSFNMESFVEVVEK